jgi:hypothetical protein
MGHLTRKEDGKVKVLSCADAQKCIRDWARKNTGILLTHQVCNKMMERGVSELDIKRVLRRGSLDGGITQTAQGEWKCKMTLRIRGERIIGAGILILHDKQSLLINSVLWEDFG